MAKFCNLFAPILRPLMTISALMVMLSADVAAQDCESDSECGEGEACFFPRGECESSGTCERRPDAFTQDHSIFCLCDGTERRGSSTSSRMWRVRNAGECEPPTNAPDTELDEPSTTEELTDHHRLLIERTDEVLRIIQELRGIDSTGPIDRDVQSRGELRERLADMVQEEMTEEQLADDERLMRALGLLPAEIDYLEMMLDLLEDQIAGFYDDEEKIFYILDDMPMNLQEPVMAHELFHAIQDQVWGIRNLRGSTELMTDATMALTSIIEGDALAVMMDFSAGGTFELSEIPMVETMLSSSMNERPAEIPEHIPDMIWQQLVYPYIGGVLFVIEAHRRGGWQAVNAVYSDLPTTTEQVMHPERYFDRDEPTWLTYDLSEALPDAERYYVDVLGEFILSASFAQLLDDLVSRASVARALDGWDGDRLEAWRFPNEPERDIVTMMIVMDDETEAIQLAQVASRLTSPWTGTAERIEIEGAHGGRYSATNDGASVVVERWGDLVMIALSRGGSMDDEARVAELLSVIEAAWDSHERWSYPDLSQPIE